MKITSFSKCLIAFNFLLLSITAVNAQTVQWDSTYRPGKYVELVKKFKDDPKSKEDIVFQGNSITAGTDWAKLLDLPQAKNRASLATSLLVF